MGVLLEPPEWTFHEVRGEKKAAAENAPHLVQEAVDKGQPGVL